jgi:hypothetical protein
MKQFKVAFWIGMRRLETIISARDIFDAKRIVAAQYNISANSVDILGEI